jgi:hypothetical protein
MKRSILFCVLLMPFFAGKGQTGSAKPAITTEWKDSSPPPPPAYPQWNFLADPDWKAATQANGVEWGTLNGIKGSPFFNEEWTSGSVLLTDNRQASNIPIRFNVYSNEIYFLRDSQVLAIDASVPVREFTLYDHRSDLAQSSLFRCGYPDTRSGNKKTFYLVLASGKLSLLIHYSKRVVERNSPIDGPQKLMDDEESWFVFSAPQNKMIEIRQNRNSLMSALPAEANRIETILSSNKMKLKQKNDWIVLFNELNKS